MLVAYLRHADAYYTKNGRPTKELANLRLAVRALRQLHGHALARDFGPRHDRWPSLRSPPNDDEIAPP